MLNSISIPTAPITFSPSTIGSESVITFTFSGSSVFTGSADGDWSLVLKSNGNLNITSMPTNVDIFAVGGGGNGGLSSTFSDGGVIFGLGGGGGGGGYRTTLTNVKLNETSYTVNIAPATGSSSITGIITASGGTNGGELDAGTGGASGGRGGNSASNAGGAGGDGGYAFNDANFNPGGGFPAGYRFGAGGGGAGGYDSRYGFAGGGAGGTNGGGAGAYAGGGENAVANSGSGGGGCAPYGSTRGAGGTGIIIIRNAR